MKRAPLNTHGSATVADLGERGIIADIRARVPEPPPWLRVGIGDDAAVAEPARGELEVLTIDALIEGVHFDRRFSAPRDIGWRALAVNVSDVAAMGAAPRLALLSLGLPPSLPIADLHDLLDGFLELAQETRTTLAGGNISRSPGPLMIDVVVTGSARGRNVLTRAGGRPGDELYVTGAIGAGAAGLAWLRAAETPGCVPEDPALAACVERYRRPEPRWRLGALLGRNRAASACIDLSDGLADGVQQIAESSSVGAAIDAAAVPLARGAMMQLAASGAADPFGAALAGGDDYELLIAVPRRARGRLATVARQARGVAITRIGVLTSEPDVRLVRDGVPSPLPRGFVHF